MPSFHGSCPRSRRALLWLAKATPSTSTSVDGGDSDDKRSVGVSAVYSASESGGSDGGQTTKSSNAKEVGCVIAACSRNVRSAIGRTQGPRVLIYCELLFAFACRLGVWVYLVVSPTDDVACRWYQDACGGKTPDRSWIATKWTRGWAGL